MPTLIEFRPGNLPHVEAFSTLSRVRQFHLPKHFVPETDMPISQIAALNGLRLSLAGLVGMPASLPETIT